MLVGEVAGQAPSWGAWSLLPPLLAIGLAVVLRRVTLALFAGVLAGAVLIAEGNLLLALQQTLTEYLIGSSEKFTDHLKILVFTTLLGTMVGVMTRNGAMQAVIERIVKPGRNRCQGQQMTCGLGLAIFFDDYANTLVVGTAMRPLTDRLKISREKLAFLVDATAAPVAGLSVISTWVAYEIGLIGESYAAVDQKVDSYGIFLKTVPYRFYSILLLVFVWTIARSGRDFGAMRRAEERAVMTGEVSRPGRTAAPSLQAAAATKNTKELPAAYRGLDLYAHTAPPSLPLAEPPDGQPTSGEPDGPEVVVERPLVRNAVIPLVLLLVTLLVGVLGWGGDSMLNVMLVASLVASFSSLGLTWLTRAVPFRESLAAWRQGAFSMFQALGILILAWALAAVCAPQYLNTAGYLVDLVGQGLPVQWMPTLSFVLAAVIALATGSSFSTMALLIPLSLPISWNLLTADTPTPVDPADPLLLATLGAVLAGAIFGDHCSPISDTTVLSSAAAGCDHLDHVATQAPYAVVVAGIALLMGYVPVGFGVPIGVCLPLSIATAIGCPLLLGRQIGSDTGDKTIVGDQ